METVQVVKTAVGELKDYDWLSYTDSDGESQLVVDDDDIEAAAVSFNMTPEAVKAIKDALQFLAQTLIEELEKDLGDIWLVANDES